MNVFQTHSRIVSDYETYIHSFLRIADPKIREVVENELNQGKLWPEPLLQLTQPVEQISGMSGAPVFGLAMKDGRFWYTITGIQTAVRENRCIVCPTRVFVPMIREWLEGLPSELPL